ncbi:MAG TPA: lycopene cyclase domain-containing protein [Cytophagales bacterium]|jgi:lycopene cyclase domain-containing protein|nr:lycopene cyclase domain-containing protein [Cytophagales bacterium]
MQFTYLILNLFTIVPIIALSFNKRYSYSQYWKHTIPGLFVVGTFFVIWDIFFTRWGVWQFNPLYVMPFRFWGLPIEEYLFFLVTPFACIFIYECVGVFGQPNWFYRLAKPIALFFAIVLGGLAVSFFDRLYTSVNFGLGALLMLVAVLRLNNQILGQFWLAFLLHLIPFFIVNGVLTSWPVVIYNNAENLGMRVGTIPIEDFAYSFLLFLPNLWSFLWLKKNKPNNYVAKPTHHH